MHGALKGGCPAGAVLDMTVIGHGAMTEVMVGDVLAITGAVWPDPKAAPAKERRLGLVVIPSGDHPPVVPAAAAPSSFATADVAFSAWELQTSTDRGRLHSAWLPRGLQVRRETS